MLEKGVGGGFVMWGQRFISRLLSGGSEQGGTGSGGGGVAEGASEGLRVPRDRGALLPRSSFPPPFLALLYPPHHTLRIPPFSFLLPANSLLQPLFLPPPALSRIFTPNNPCRDHPLHHSPLVSHLLPHLTCPSSFHRPPPCSPHHRLPSPLLTISPSPPCL